MLRQSAVVKYCILRFLLKILVHLLSPVMCSALGNTQCVEFADKQCNLSGKSYFDEIIRLHGASARSLPEFQSQRRAALESYQQVRLELPCVESDANERGIRLSSQRWCKGSEEGFICSGDTLPAPGTRRSRDGVARTDGCRCCWPNREGSREQGEGLGGSSAQSTSTHQPELLA